MVPSVVRRPPCVSSDRRKNNQTTKLYRSHWPNRIIPDYEQSLWPLHVPWSGNAFVSNVPSEERICACNLWAFRNELPYVDGNLPLIPGTSYRPGHHVGDMMRLYCLTTYCPFCVVIVVAFLLFIDVFRFLFFFFVFYLQFVCCYLTLFLLWILV